VRTRLSVDRGKCRLSIELRNNSEIVFRGKLALGAILILSFDSDNRNLSHQWHFTKQKDNLVISDNTKERHRIHAVHSSFINKTGKEYERDLVIINAKELLFTHLRRLLHPVRPLISTVKGIIHSS
jgi:hypothetical protein